MWKWVNELLGRKSSNKTTICIEISTDLLRILKNLAREKGYTLSYDIERRLRCHIRKPMYESKIMDLVEFVDAIHKHQNQYLILKDIGAILKKDADWVSNCVQRGEIKYIRKEKRAYVITKEELLDWANRNPVLFPR